jgi:endopeptidase Clp ATP-binding regulatory subunit ClpX
VKDRVPTPEELQRELREFLKKNFGDGVQDVKLVYPDPDSNEDNTKETRTQQEDKFNLNFNLKPKEVKAYLDKYIIKQDDAKKTLAIAICDHYNHVSECARLEKEQRLSKIQCESEEEYAKQNVLLVGPTGVGKTYLIKTLAKLIGVPFVKADATKFSETGYVGGNVEDIIRDLVTEADGNIELAQYGMVFIDEIDKIASASNMIGKDVSGRGVQTGLLKLMEETEVDLNTPYDPISQMKALMDFQKKGKVEKQIINTKHILFFVSGAFNQLEEIIKERIHKQGIGFGAEVKSKSIDVDYLKDCRSSDLVKFGFEPELVGRLPVRVVCHELSADDLLNILKHSEGSIIKQYKRAFKAYGIDVVFSEESLRMIAERAYEEKTGARALATVCEKVFREFKFELPSTDVKSFIVTDKMVEDPVKGLRNLLSDPSENKKRILKEMVREYERGYADKYKITLKFSDEAIELVNERATLEGISIKVLCDKLLEDYIHGLNLIKRNTGKSEFAITDEVIRDPVGTLDKWVKQHYTASQTATDSPV